MATVVRINMMKTMIVMMMMVVMMMMLLLMMMMLVLRMMMPMSMMMITDTTHRDLWPRPTCRGRHTHPPTDPDLKVNSMCLLRPNLPDRLRPTCPNSRACQPDCCWEGGAK